MLVRRLVNSATATDMLESLNVAAMTNEWPRSSLIPESTPHCGHCEIWVWAPRVQASDSLWNVCSARIQASLWNFCMVASLWYVYGARVRASLWYFNVVSAYRLVCGICLWRQCTGSSMELASGARIHTYVRSVKGICMQRQSPRQSLEFTWERFS